MGLFDLLWLFIDMIVFIDERIGVGDDVAILEVDDAVGILLREFRVVGDHDDEPVFGNFLEQLHDLYRSLGIKSSGWLVRQKDIGIVDQGSCDRNSLHLTAGHLIWLFMGLFLETNFFKSF